MRLGKFKEARLNDSAGKLLVILGNTAQCTFNVKGVQRECSLTLVPVSYTHLDVYKRQAYDTIYNKTGSACC